jgi:hypothetical protein
LSGEVFHREEQVSALVRFFFSPVYAPQSAWSILGWWESRRPIYNAVLAVAGGLSLVAQTLLALLPPRVSPEVPLGLVGIVAYAVLANVCYCAGPAVELYIRRRWGDGYAVVGPALFRYGFAFSVGLTLLPIPLAFLDWIIRALWR